MFNETNKKYLVVYNIITYFLSKIKINITDFCNVQILCNDHIKTLGKGKEKETWLNRNAGQTATAGEPHFITVPATSTSFRQLIIFKQLICNCAKIGRFFI